MRSTVVLFADSQGIVSRGGIGLARQQHMTCTVRCGDTAPHVTTIAQCVSTLGEDVAHAVAAVLAVCDTHGSIGREIFAIDGVTLPSHASTQRRGARADFARQAATLEGLGLT